MALNLSKLLLALVLLYCPAPSLAVTNEEPEIGDTYDIKIGEMYKGWTSKGGGLLKDDHDLSYELFEKENRLIIVITKPLTRNPRGGFGVEQILHKKEVAVLKGKKYTWEDCGLLGYDAAVTYLDNETNIATGYFALPSGIQVWQWVVNWNYCSVP